MLKALYDAGKDHIDMFLPFIVDSIDVLGKQTFAPSELKDDITARHGLTIPLNTIETLLSRLTKRGHVAREAGVYRAVRPAPKSTTLLARRSDIEHRMSQLASSLRIFATAAGLQVGTDDQAVDLLLTFLGANQPELLLNHFELTSAALPEGMPRTSARIVARYLKEQALRDPDLSNALQSILAGLVLQNALLLRDITDASRRFEDLAAALDSHFLLGALGFAGQYTQRSFRESIDILKECGVRLEVYEQTIDEMIRILAVYETKLATRAGRESLYPTDITRHLLITGATPSDIREAIALIPTQLKSLGLRTRSSPSRDRRYTLDEEALTEHLRRPHEQSTTPRVQHDVNMVAATLTIRAGRLATRLENARAVFVTTSSHVVRSIKEWFQAAGEPGISPVVHQRALTNAAWLKKPAAAQQLVLHELVTLCAAALSPSRRLWESFLEHLRQLETKGTISTDEAAVLVTSELTDHILAECDDETIEEESILAIRERVMDKFRSEAGVLSVDATARANSAEEAHRRLVLVHYGRADRLASWISFIPAVVIAAIYVFSTLLGFPGLWEMLPDNWRLTAKLLLLAGGLLGGVGLYTGFHLRGARLTLEGSLRPRLRKIILGVDTR